MQVRIIRDEHVRPGGEGVLEMLGDLLFVVSADGVTEGGAGALEECWRWFIDRGIWRYGTSGGRQMTATYHLAHLGGAAARVRTAGAHVDCWCSPEHFTRGSLNGLEAAVRASVRRGWRYYAPAESHARTSR